MSFRKNLSDYLSFTKSERNGIIVLISIIVLLLLTIFLFDKFVEKGKTDFKQFENEIKESFTNLNSDEQAFDTIFSFDPNKATIEELAMLGFTQKNINTLIKLKNKNFKFYKPDDLLKIYGLDSNLYLKLKDSIVIESEFVKVEKYKQNYNSHEISNNIKIDNFNPNIASFSELVNNGFSKKQANNLLKYREKIGFFKEKTDLKKIYAIDEDFYKKIEAYIIIEKTESVNSDNNLVELININTADSLMLIKIKGIGPSYAKRILKYRTLLGGFYKIEQLKEVYGMTDELYNSIQNLFYISINDIKTINVNKATFKEINSHPLIDYQLTKAIVEVRGFNGDFESIEDLVKFKLIDKEKYNILKYYLSIK